MLWFKTASDGDFLWMLYVSLWSEGEMMMNYKIKYQEIKP